jgi:hypothetical protein
MLKEYTPHIGPEDNLVIVVGDSFTQGIGAYSADIWKKYYGQPHFNIVGELYRDQQMSNNWASQLVKNHLSNFKVVNLAVNGVGNRAAAKEIYLNTIPKTSGKVFVIFMISGLQRFDFLKTDYNGKDHMRWLTVWPIPDLHKGQPIEQVEKWYAHHGHSDKTSIIETLMAISEVSNFSKANGYEFVFANAFDTLFDLKAMNDILGEDSGLLNIVNWNRFVPNNFTLEFLKEESTELNLWKYTSKLKEPSKYITPCNHWTIEGHRVVAEHIYKFLKEKHGLEL